MKAIFSHHLRIPSGIFFVLIGFLLTPTSLLAQEPDNVRSELFTEVDAAMEKARSQGTPVYAPTLFAKALEIYNRAQLDYKKGESLRRIRERIRQALKSLNEAIKAAKVSHVVLGELITVRQEAAKPEYIILASKDFAKAERKYQQAILKAEAGDVLAANKKAEQAILGYREMFIIALLNGPIKNAEVQLNEARKTLEKKDFANAKRTLEALKKSVSNSKKQQFGIATYEAEIIAKIEELIRPPLPAIAIIQPEKLKTKVDTSRVSVRSLLYRSVNSNPTVKKWAVQELALTGKNPHKKKRLNTELQIYMSQDPEFEQWVIKNRNVFPNWLNIPKIQQIKSKIDIAVMNLEVLKAGPLDDSQLKLQFTLSNLGKQLVFAEDIYLVLDIITASKQENLADRRTPSKPENTISGVLSTNQRMRAFSESGMGIVLNPGERCIIIVSPPFDFIKKASRNIKGLKTAFLRQLPSDEYQARIMAIALENQDYKRINAKKENWYDIQYLKRISKEKSMENNYAFSR